MFLIPARFQICFISVFWFKHILLPQKKKWDWKIELICNILSKIPASWCYKLMIPEL